jgi:hypothetical protein
MALPGIDAERWRLVEQKLAEFGVDIQRLWRQVQQTQVGGPAQSGALTPTDLAALTAAGSGGGGSTVPVYHVAVRGAASSGTISWAAAIRGVSGSTVTGTFNYDDDEADMITALSGFDPDVDCKGGTLLWNVNRIKFSDPDMIFGASDHDLVRESYSPQPKVEVYRCEEPASRWA